MDEIELLGNKSDKEFEDISCKNSIEYKDALKAITERLKSYDLPDFDENINTILATKNTQYFSGKNTGIFGILGINPQILSQYMKKGNIYNALIGTEESQKIADCLIVHEYLHSYLSPEKKVLDAKYYEIAKFFHQEIIPRRLQEERFEISYYDTYIQDKSYKNLVGYHETNKARTFTDKYFNYFLKDGIKTNPFGGISIPAAISKDAAKRMEGMPNKTIQELRQENQTDCIKKIITGFMCINKIQDSEKSFTDLNIEEGFVTWLSCKLTGISIDTFNKMFKQDEDKIMLAKKFEALQLDPKTIFNEVKDMNDVLQLTKKIEKD